MYRNISIQRKQVTPLRLLLLLRFYFEPRLPGVVDINSELFEFNNDNNKGTSDHI